MRQHAEHLTRRVLITGGAAGIGRAVVDRLAHEGYECIVLDRQKPDGAFPGRWIETDLADVDATARALAEAGRLGPITRLVNNVGIVRPAPLEEATFADLEAAVALNLRCTLQCTQALLAGMKTAAFGRIVNVSSRSALGRELRTVYAATKSGIHGFTRTWALELGRHGITVNAVAPGPIRTALFEAANPAESVHSRDVMNRIPVGRIGEPEDVAHAIASLLDERAGFITGQVLCVCGGLTVGAVA
jgi:NAD(P)-dependent dehydrogenase (short-subunit alcohol dehydrogenase family)